MASQDATLVDKLLLIPTLASVLVAALVRLVTSPITGGNKPRTLFKDVVFAALRANLASMNLRQERWMRSSTKQEYLALAKKENFTPETDLLEGGGKLHWLGPKNAEKTIIYFHGGGYVLPATGGHLSWLSSLQKESSKTKSTAIAVLSYTLAPDGQYPTQLRQATEGLALLLNKMGKKPGDILLAGDSAGGNLTLGVISHLLHPHPEVTAKIDTTEPFAGVVLISPWIKFAVDEEAFKRNINTDMLPKAAAKRWSEAFLGSSALDNYNQPILADSKWFSGIDRVTKDILVWGGGGEVLIESIREIGLKLKEAFPKTEIVIQPGAAHEDFIMDKFIGYTERSEGEELVASWVRMRLYTQPLLYLQRPCLYAVHHLFLLPISLLHHLSTIQDLKHEVRHTDPIPAPRRFDTANCSVRNDIGDDLLLIIYVVGSLQTSINTAIDNIGLSLEAGLTCGDPASYYGRTIPEHCYNNNTNEVPYREYLEKPSNPTERPNELEERTLSLPAFPGTKKSKKQDKDLIRGRNLQNWLQDPTRAPTTKFNRYKQLEEWGWVEQPSKTTNYDFVAQILNGEPSLNVGTLKDGIQMHLKHTEDTRVMDKSYPATNADYNNIFYVDTPSGGVILANNNHNPDHRIQKGETPKPWVEGALVTELSRLSDVMFLSWLHLTSPEGLDDELKQKLLSRTTDRHGDETERLSEECKALRKDLHYVIRRNILNEETKRVMKKILKAGRYKLVGGLAVGWPGTVVEPDDKNWPLLLATPNVSGVAWLLIQHQEELGPKTIKSIRTFKEKPLLKWGYTPSMVIEIGAR